MLNVWTQKTGYNLGVIYERQYVNITLPTISDVTGISFKKIAGALPAGLSLVNNTLVGVPFEVSREVTSTFVIRAYTDDDFADLTFSILTEGPNNPVWITNSGLLPVSPTNLAFVLDSSYINFQLSAIDSDLPAGDSLKYFIGENDGTLPPGLTLSESGVISGIIDPIIAVDLSTGTGFFDTNGWDSQPFDMGIAPPDGFSTYNYDALPYDYFSLGRTPRKLNRNYEFNVSVSDGRSVVKRTFRIFVVGDDFLRTDNDITRIGSNTFTADNTYLRAPIWLSANNLGIKRANNFITILLQAHDPVPALGPVMYRLESVNDDSSNSVLPSGLYLDESNGEIFGYIPYQPAVTKEYKFTISAIKYDISRSDIVVVTIAIATYAFQGQQFIKIHALDETSRSLLIGQTIRIGNGFYRILDYMDDPINPTGDIKIATLNIPLIENLFTGTTASKTFNASPTELSISKASKTFTLAVIGEVDSVITWKTSFNLGTLLPNYPSTLVLLAETTVPYAKLSYSITDGYLPPGLILTPEGEIQGKVNQYEHEGIAGLTIFDNHTTTFDGGAMTIDRNFTFTVIAEDQFKYSAISGTFTIIVNDPDTKMYSNLYVKPMQTLEKRKIVNDFLYDYSIFEPNLLYRNGDPSFGMQYEMRMLFYAGLETTFANTFIAALQYNNRKKRYTLGNPKIAKAYPQGSWDAIYEVIYVEVFDEYEIGNQEISGVNSNTNTAAYQQMVISTTLKDIELNLSAITEFLSDTNYEQPLNANLQDNLDAITEFLSIVNYKPPVSSDMAINIRAITDFLSDVNYFPPISYNEQPDVPPEYQLYNPPNSQLYNTVFMRNNLAQLIVNDRQIVSENAFLPLWMVSPQDKYSVATGFIKAVPLCYCKPSKGSIILNNIIKSGFDFSTIDYEIDRYIIDSTLNNMNEQYLKFPTDTKTNI